MVHQVLHLDKNGVQTINILSNDTAVIVLLVHFCEQMKLKCSLIMEATSSERSSTEIQATVKKNQDIVPKLLAAYGITGCDSVVRLHGIGK